jgi:hypothetical protein
MPLCSTTQIEGRESSKNCVKKPWKSSFNVVAEQRDQSPVGIQPGMGHASFVESRERFNEDLGRVAQTLQK